MSIPFALNPFGRGYGEPLPPDNEVWYWADSQVTLYTSTGVVSHTFSGGKGVLTFASAVTDAREWFRGVAVKMVYFPLSLTNMTRVSFYNTSQLEFVRFDGCVAIRDYAFRGCTKLAIDKIPSGVTVIEASAFNSCSSLAITSLPSVTAIGNGAFAGCRAITRMSIPNVTVIPNECFLNCQAMTDIEMSDSVTSIGASAFTNCILLPLQHLPNSLISIGDGAFEQAFIVAVSRIPASVTTIGNRAFAHCRKITSLTFEGTPSSVSSTAFIQCTNLRNIYVPWSEGEVAGAPWGAQFATIHYNWTN